jgi:hypothetical protein
MSATKFAVIHASPRATVRTETFQGRTFRVVPAVLVRSQVLRNNLGVAFLPADEITDEWAEQWNGIPVLVGPHPSQHGHSVSGRTPELWDARGAGWVFNAGAEQESPQVRRLVAEVWLDIARAAAVQGLREILNRINSGQTVELSTGFHTCIEPRAGHFQGEPFELVMHPINPDHLVISTEMTGACSVRDGCGLGANCACGTCGNKENVEAQLPSGERVKVAVEKGDSDLLGVVDETGRTSVYALPVLYWEK